MIDAKDMFYCEKLGGVSDSVTGLIKEPGEDNEFYALTWKNEKFSDLCWVHYQ